jgi:hypothetical protein
MVSRLVVSLFAIALANGCANDWRPLATPVDGNPCGNAWHQCFAGEPLEATGMCCGDGDACGGGPFNGCPSGSCCPTREGDSLAGASRPYPQRPERSGAQ